MFLKSLKLINIRCFKDLYIDFDLPGGNNRKWTVLTGENGTGKSTILKSIALVLVGSEALHCLVDEPDRWIRTGEDTGEIIAEVETKSEKSREIKLVFKRGEKFSQFLNRAISTLDRLNAALEHSQRSYLTIAFGSTRRMGQAGVSLSKSSRHYRGRAQSVASLFDSEAALNPLESWAMEVDYETEGEGIIAIKDVLSDFLPEMTFSHIDRKKKTLMFDTPDGEVSLRSLSDGYQNVAAWVGDLLYQITSIFEDYKNPLQARGLLIIDEVDLHLHPKWQRRLLDFLETRLPNMQLVVTTHSVVTAQQSPEGALHYCLRRDGVSLVERFDLDPGNLLLNELIATEAFGQLSDESLHVEEIKDEYKSLKRKPQKSDDDYARMKKISDEVVRPIETDASAVMNAEQQALIKKILASQSE